MGLAAGVLVGAVLQATTEASWVQADGVGGLERLVLDPDCERAVWLAPFSSAAAVFMRLLKMLIVPLILTSIVTGVAGVAGNREFENMQIHGVSPVVAINVFRPGVGAELPLAVPDAFDPGRGRSFADILERMVPENVFGALSENGRMLQVIFFALVFGFFIARSAEVHRKRLGGLFESAFAVMMGVAGMVLKLIPLGVFALMVKMVGETGFSVFRPLLAYMAVVAGALAVHSCLVLPALLRFVGGIRPGAWVRAMAPALLTALSTSSSSITLPATLEAAEKRGGISNKISSFVLPLGATINMDGTALYECVGVIFLSQFYASAGGFELTLGMQAFIVVTALLASIGAAGIPSAGLVMMLAILSGLGLPVEGAALLLAIDRPLDMLRTGVNIWSDSCGAALIARSEGETVVGAPA